MNLDFNNICRLCLKLTKASVDLFPKNGVRDLSKEEADKIIEKIEYCYSIQIQPGDELPTKICHKCIHIVTLFYISKQNTSQSDQFLKNSLLLKRLAERDGCQDLESNDKTISENESNNGYTSGSSVQIIGEIPSTSTQEIDKKDFINLPSPEPSGSHKLINKSGKSSFNDEGSSARMSDTVKNSEASFSQSNKKVLVKPNVDDENMVEISKKSKSSKLSRKAIQRRARKLLRRKNNIIVSTVKDNEDDVLTSQSDSRENPDINNWKISEPLGNEIKISDKSYPNEGDHKDNTAINCKSNEISHDLNSNALDSTSNICPNPFALVKNAKIKSESQNGKTKVLVKSSKNKEDKLKDYYEKLLNTDKSLKVKYCRLTFQKSELRKEMAIEKKKTHDVNMKIYNLVRAAVNVASAVSEMSNFNDKEKMERVFDRLIRGDGEFENFVKGQQKPVTSEIGDENKNDENNKNNKRVDIKTKPSGNNLPGNFHEKLTANWNDLQAELSEKDKNSDNVLDKSESESSKDKSKIQKTAKKRPPEEVKVIGTDIDLQNILSPDVKRKRVSKEQSDQKTTSPSSEIKSEPESEDDEIMKAKKKRTVGEKAGFKKKLLKLTKNKLKQK